MLSLCSQTPILCLLLLVNAPRGVYAASPATNSCGISCEAPSVVGRGVYDCLEEHFGSRQTSGPTELPSLVSLYNNPTFYSQARKLVWGDRYPAAVVYAANVSDVRAAVTCAYENGYSISGRSRGNSFQGRGTANGAVVVDVSRTCHPDEILIDRTAQGPHLAPGSRYIATVKAGAGCTAMVLLSAIHESFEPSDGAMTVIGTCPTVGLSGFTLGGGMGDITPYAGLAIDTLVEVEMVLYNGTVIKASEQESQDMFWATRGGGPGYGIITSLKFKVIESPNPLNGTDDRHFSVFQLYFSPAEEAFIRLQDFMYSSESSNRFAGNGYFFNWNNHPDDPKDFTYLQLVWTFLGSWTEGLAILEKAGLTELLLPATPIIWEDFVQTCNGSDPCDVPDAPGYGMEVNEEYNGLYNSQVREYKSFGELESYRICTWAHATFLGAGITNSSADICTDLGVPVNSTSCIIRSINPLYTDLNCDDKTVIERILDVGGDPNSFLNQFGRSRSDDSAASSPIEVPAPGAVALPRMENETLREIMRNAGFDGFEIFHFAQGTPLQVAPDATAYPWRNAAIITTPLLTTDVINTILRDKAFGGDVNNLQGYYDYPWPRMSNWRRFYWGSNWEKLTTIKGKYDGLNVFGQPDSVETPLLQNEEVSCSSDRVQSSLAHRPVPTRWRGIILLWMMALITTT